MRPSANQIILMNGNAIGCKAVLDVSFMIQDKQVALNCLVSNILPGCDFLLGMDCIDSLGGVLITRDQVAFGPSSGHEVSAVAVSQPELVVEDKDFRAEFRDGHWEASWKWVDSEARLTNQVGQYSLREGVQEKFDEEIEEWLRKGWLVEYEGPSTGILPLMAVVQENKQKTRPVLDYRELNTFVSSHTAESDVCAEKLRQWRKMGESVTMIDLRKAYLQIRIHPSLWKYQVVKYKEHFYCLTRLGFGLNVAPKIMTSILRKVLSLDPDISLGTDNYLDDIAVNETVVSSARVCQHLKKFGLEPKSPEPLDGGRVLGLRVGREDDRLVWRRDNCLCLGSENVKTKRDVFSLCGKLIGHFPVAGWLRPACSFLKRQLNSLEWKDSIDKRSFLILSEILNRVEEQDPVRGDWAVKDCSRGRVWCDASSLAVGVVVDIDGKVVEDSAWLRKQSDNAHINLAELDSVLKGVNLALKWNLRDIEVVTDSATVRGWLLCIIEKSKRVSTHGLAEMLVRRRLGVLESLCSEYGVTLRVSLVKSAENLADKLTRVPNSWLRSRDDLGQVCAVADVGEGGSQLHDFQLVQDIHNLHHLGVDRTLFFVRQCQPRIDRQVVERIIKSCIQCQQIDPAPVCVEKGTLAVDRDWRRLAVDVTHVKDEISGRASKYLTIVDCGPSRYAVWKKIRDESAQEIRYHLESIFSERGPPDEIIFDNYTSFKSKEVLTLLKDWSVAPHYRCAYKPEGNGIVERNHRTIKRMAARSKSSVEKMLFYYNNSPRSGCKPPIVPSERVYCYKIRLPGIHAHECDPCDTSEEALESSVDSPYRVGDLVFVKPPRPSCTEKWGRGRVTDVLSKRSVEVDGVARHLSDVRPVVEESQDVCAEDPCETETVDVVVKSATRADEMNVDVRESGSADEAGQQGSQVSERPRRHTRRLPGWLQDFEVG